MCLKPATSQKSHAENYVQVPGYSQLPLFLWRLVHGLIDKLLKPFVRITIAAVLLALLSACSARPVAPVSDLSSKRQPAKLIRIVRPGDTLYSIAWAAGVDYRQVANWNGLVAPYIVFPGQNLSLVPTGRHASRSNPTKKPVTVATKVAPVSAPTKVKISPIPTPVPESKPEKSVSKDVRQSPAQTKSAGFADGGWMWPVQGNLLYKFSSSTGAKGIDIGVVSGTPVRASASGRVVYAGSGLRGYGQLVIVKHSSEYLSAYGHNRKLLVQEGDSIRRGQTIAESGSDSGRGELLHFEIRRNGKPINPEGLLPQKQG